MMFFVCLFVVFFGEGGLVLTNDSKKLSRLIYALLICLVWLIYGVVQQENAGGSVAKRANKEDIKYYQGSG